MKHEFDPSRRKFIKTGLIWLPVATALTRFSVLDVVGASAIKSRTYSSVIDERIALSNSHFARPHGVGTWNKLRIALRVSMTDTGAGLTSLPDFSVGLCAGTTNIYKDATTDHFVGVRTEATSWTRSGTSYYSASGGGTSLRSIKRVGSTITSGGAIGSSYAFNCNNNAASAALRWLYFVDITKGSPNYTLDVFVNGAVSAVDISAADFLLYAPNASPTVSGHSFAGGTPSTVAVDEATNGTLNCVNLHWDQVDPKIELSDIAIVRLS